MWLNRYANTKSSSMRELGYQASALTVHLGDGRGERRFAMVYMTYCTNV